MSPDDDIYTTEDDIVRAHDVIAKRGDVIASRVDIIASRCDDIYTDDDNVYMRDKLPGSTGSRLHYARPETNAIVTASVSMVHNSIHLLQKGTIKAYVFRSAADRISDA